MATAMSIYGTLCVLVFLRFSLSHFWIFKGNRYFYGDDDDIDEEDDNDDDNENDKDDDNDDDQPSAVHGRKESSGTAGALWPERL